MSADHSDDHDEQGDDRRLFRDAMRGVKPVRAAPAPPSPPRPKPRAHLRRRDQAAVLPESLHPLPGEQYGEDGEAVFFARQGVAAAVLARLRRGQYRVETQIDLHGLTATQAREALREFLQAMQREQARCVRVIHGKGRRSGHLGPVLKPAVQAMLQKIDAVLAYASARPADGGTGALYVLLR